MLIDNVSSESAEHFVFLTSATLCIARSLRQRRVRLSVRPYVWHTPVLYHNEEISTPLQSERGHPERGRFVGLGGCELAILAIFRSTSRLICEIVQDATKVTIDYITNRKWYTRFRLAPVMVEHI